MEQDHAQQYPCCLTVPLLSDGAPGVSRFSSGDILFQGATRPRDDGLDQDHVKGANNLREIAPHAPYAQGTVKSTLFLLYLEATTLNKSELERKIS